MAATMSVRTVKPWLAYGASRGLDVRELAEACGVGEMLLENEEARLPVRSAAMLVERVAEATADPAAALHVAESLDERGLGPVAYLAITSPSLRIAMQRVVAFLPLATTAARYRMELAGDDAWFVVDVLDASLSRYQLELAVAINLMFPRRFVEGGFAATGVYFRHGPPACLAEYRRLLGPNLHFNADFTGYRFSANDLERPMRRADPGLSDTLESYATEMLRRIPAEDDWGRAVRNAVRAAVEAGGVSLPRVARVLAVSSRTLQRRLSERGETLGGIVAEVKCEMAKALLSRADLSVSDVAFLLGFSDPANFYRAFKRWTGHSPREYRAP